MPRNGFCSLTISRIGAMSPNRCQIFHTGTERADSRQHHAAGGLNLSGIARDDGLKTDALKAFLHAAQIAHTVVNDRDHIWTI